MLKKRRLIDWETPRMPTPDSEDADDMTSADDILFVSTTLTSEDDSSEPRGSYAAHLRPNLAKPGVLTTILMVDFDSLQLDAASGNADDRVFRKVVGDPMADNLRQLSLLVLACEPKMPYGPNEHTAGLLLDLLALAVQSCAAQDLWTLTLKIFDVQKDEYPSDDEWDTYDGVIVPGSFSSAYEEVDWIAKLKSVIQERIVAEHRPTIGICFGHQVFAHSFDKGLATKTPSGARSGRVRARLTPEGARLFGTVHPDLDLYFSHGDRVETLPPCAVALSGDEKVPIQSAAYFGSEEEVQRFRNGNNVRPFAVTFQAHPEYATSKDLGIYRTLELVMDAMERRGDIAREDRLKLGQDAHDHFDSVQQQSVDAIVKVGQLFGWFPAAMPSS